MYVTSQLKALIPRPPPSLMIWKKDLEGGTMYVTSQLKASIPRGPPQSAPGCLHTNCCYCVICTPDKPSTIIHTVWRNSQVIHIHIEQYFTTHADILLWGLLFLVTTVTDFITQDCWHWLVVFHHCDLVWRGVIKVRIAYCALQCDQLGTFYWYRIRSANVWSHETGLVYCCSSRRQGMAESILKMTLPSLCQIHWWQLFFCPKSRTKSSLDFTRAWILVFWISLQFKVYSSTQGCPLSRLYWRIRVWQNCLSLATSMLIRSCLHKSGIIDEGGGPARRRFIPKASLPSVLQEEQRSSMATNAIA